MQTSVSSNKCAIANFIVFWQRNIFIINKYGIYEHDVGCVLLKNDINTYPTTITPDGKVIDKKILKIIPAISVTASDVIGDNYNARFAIINSWDGIVPLMDSTQGSSSQSSIIKLKGKIFNKGNHPPKKSIEAKALINNIFAYSAKKNKAKVIAEYSTL